MEVLAVAKDWSIVLAGTIALITFVTGALEYRRRGRQERAATFIELRRRFLETPELRQIAHMLSTNDPLVPEIPVQDRRNFVGFIEEVALMVNSGLIHEEVACIVYGHYVKLVDATEAFWSGLEPRSRYWTLFRQFSERTRQLEARSVNRANLRF